MNCCDDYGDCNQGRECPARSTNDEALACGKRKVKPYPAVPVAFDPEPEPKWMALQDLAIGFVYAFVTVLAGLLTLAIVIGAGVI